MKKLVCWLAVASAVSMLDLRAQEGEGLDDFSDAGDAPAADASAEPSDAAAEETPKVDKGNEKLFHLLPYCRRLEFADAANGTSSAAEVLTPMATTWVPIQEGKFYPLGSSYRTRGLKTRLTIQFGTEAEVSIKGEASFGTRAQAMTEKSRTVTLVSGKIKVTLPRNFPEGLFTVTAPGFKAINLAGESTYSYGPNEKGDGDVAVIRCVTGTVTVEGRHFRIPTMKAANEVRIRTSQDLLFTGLYGKSGDILVKLDQGRVLVKDFETGENKQEDKQLDWKLSPQTAVRIHRALPAIGERMSVTVMTFDASGELKNRCAFTEKTVEVNSGELGPTSKKDRDEIAKKAAEATETVAAEGEATEEAASEEGAATTEGGDAGATEEAAPAASDDLEF